VRAALAVALLALVVWAGWTTRNVDSETGRPVHPVCQEDAACWDCHTMGNRICGPGKG
jgi:hypothetical protein